MHDPRGWIALLATCALVVAAGCADEDGDLGEVSQAIGPSPVNSLPPPQTTNEDSPLFFSTVSGNAITVSDADNATLTVQITVTNGTFTLGSTSDLAVSGDGTFSVTVTGTIADIISGLDSSFYQPSANYNGPSTLQMNSSDSSGKSDLDNLGITVTAFNDPPVHNLPTGVQAAVEDVPRAFTLSIADVDIAGAPMLVTLSASNATLITLPATNGLVFTAGDGAGDAAMAFSGTLPDVNAALNGLVVTPPLNYIGASTLVITSNDQGATGAGQAGADNDTINLAWSAVNDPPVNAVPAAQTIAEEGSLTFSAGNGTALTVSDVDATTALVQITLSASIGTLTLGNPGLVTFTGGDGTADATMTFNATLTTLNSALTGTVFTPGPNVSGSATVTMVSNDLGNAGSGGARTDTDAVAVTITAQNDPPINGVPGAQLTNEDIARVFSTGNGNPITVGDADATSLQITLTASNGTVTLAGVAGLVFQSGDGSAAVTMTFTGTIASLNTALNGSRFTPTANASGAGSLRVLTSDLGATGVGGTLVDDDTIGITIAAINDPPDATNDALTVAEDASATNVSVLANDTILPDVGESLTVTGVGTALHGLASTNGTVVTYTPAPNYHGTDSVSYTISDGAGGVDTATLAITVTPVNDDPTAADDSYAVVANSVGNSLSVLSNDSAAPDLGETLTISAVGTPLHGTTAIISASTRVSYTPTAGYSGPDSFTYTIGDGSGGGDTATVTIDVVAVITQPVNTLPGPQTIVEDSPMFFSSAGSNAITVADANNASLTVQILVTNGIFTFGGTTGITFSGNSNGTSAVTASGTISALNTGLNNARYTPAANYSGPATLTINTSDTNGESDLDQLTLTVTPFNDAPVNTVPAGAQAATEDNPRAFSTISVTDIDVEGAALVITLTANNATLISLASTGGLSFTTGDGFADPTMVFRGGLSSVNVALNGLTITSTGNYIGPSTLVITTNDQGATGAGPTGEDTDTVNLTWSAVNDPPVNTVPGAQTIAEEATRTFSTANGNPLSVADVDAGVALVQITLSVTSGTLTLGSLAGLSFTSGDGSADASMTFSGTLTALASALEGTVYTPALNFAGAATLTMVANDLGNTGGAFRTDTDTVAITITAVNDAPVNGVPIAQLTNEDVARVFSAANGNAITVGDADATSLQVTLNAVNGTVTLASVTGLSFQAGDGSAAALMTFTGTIASLNTALNGVRFTPTANVSGAGSVSVTTSDLGATGAGGPLGDEDSIAITIAPVNDPPNAVNDLATVAEDATATSIAVLANDSVAPDVGESLTVTVVGTPLHGLAGTNGTVVTYTPAANYNGADSVSYTISDGAGGVDTATIAITVTSVNDAPSVGDDSYSVIANSIGNSLNVLANDSATPDLGETLTITAVGTPLHGTATIVSGPIRISYTPTGGYSGPDSFTYTLGDGNGGVDTGLVTINVVAIITQPVNSLPGPQTIVEDSPLVFSSGGGNAISVSDANNASLTVQILVSNGIFTFGGTTGITFSGNSNGTSTVTASGTITALNTGLNNAFYTPALNFHGPSALTINSSDTNGESDLDQLTLNVTSFNDPPVNTVPSGIQPATEDTPRTFASISVSDVDLDAGDLRLTLTANNNTVISLASTNGLSFTAGDGSSDQTMTFRGEQSSINVALNGVTVTSPSNYIGPSTLVITSNDLGNTGAGLPGEDTDTINLSWATINDPPINAFPGAQTTIEETALVFSTGTDTRLSISDLDVAAGTMRVTLTAVGGTVTLGDPGAVTFTAGDGVNDATMTFQATLSVVNGALEGTLYTPTLNVIGAGSLTMTSNDLGNTGGAAQTDVDIIAITVTGVNDAPVNNVPGPMVTNEDINRVFSTAQGNAITFTDVDAGTLQVSLTATNGTYTLNSTTGLVFQAGDGTADVTMTFSGTIVSCTTAMNASRFIPTPQLSGIGSVTLLTSDLGASGTGGALADEDTIVITINPINDNPDAVNDAQTLAEDATAVTIDALANDTSAPDLGETLTISATSTPLHGAVVIVGGTSLSYTPVANYFGADSFTYTINDGNTGVDTATVSLTITTVNDPPVANDDAFTVLEGSNNNAFAVRGNDTALPDTGETLTVIAVTTPTHGSASITGTGSNTAISYTPTAAYNGPDSLTYTLSDPGGAIDTATVTITVTSVSTQPVAVDDTIAVAEDGNGVVTVLANDTGQGDAPITVLAETLPLHGGIVVQGDQTVRYTPAANYHGPDSFTYRLTDLDGQFDIGLVTVTVQPTEDLPVAVDDTLVTVEDTAAVVTVLTNDQSIADLPAVVTVATQPAHGNATAAGDGTISYVPAANYAGGDAFSYTVTDLDGDASTAQVLVTITPVNDAPVAVDDDASTHSDEAVDVGVLGNDTDAEQNVLTVLSVTVPTNGTATLNGNGTVHYVPAAGFTGTDTFSYTITDGQGEQDTASVDVAVGVDTDGDGLLDVDEVNVHGTDPQNPDTDADGINDGAELGAAGTDPVDDDTDDDGLLDGNEDLDDDGPDPEESDANNPDSDDDGVQDGTESGLAAPQGQDTDAGVFVPDADPASLTDPLTADTDDGGATDGEEDLDGNGRIDAGETDPNDPGDDPGPPDGDSDSVPDDDDNCPTDFNPNQADADEDGLGDVCDDTAEEPSGCCQTGGGGEEGVLVLLIAVVMIGARRRRH